MMGMQGAHKPTLMASVGIILVVLLAYHLIHRH